jgi:hypothetical protein
MEINRSTVEQYGARATDALGYYLQITQGKDANNWEQVYCASAWRKIFEFETGTPIDQALSPQAPKE